MIYKTVYLRKMQGCVKLANMNKKRITDSDILAVSTQVECSSKGLKRAWQVFQETGGKYIDYRVKTGNGARFEAKPTIKGNHTVKNVTPEEAGSIIIEYMTTDINSRALSVKYGVALNQIYEWIHELNVSGTILGKKVLNPKKYAKLNVKDVIWMHKKPNTKRASIKELTVTEKAAYKRVARVLLEYLPQVKENKVEN